MLQIVISSKKFSCLPMCFAGVAFIINVLPLHPCFKWELDTDTDYLNMNLGLKLALNFYCPLSIDSQTKGSLVGAPGYFSHLNQITLFIGIYVYVS